MYSLLPILAILATGVNGAAIDRTGADLDKRAGCFIDPFGVLGLCGTGSGSGAASSSSSASASKSTASASASSSASVSKSASTSSGSAASTGNVVSSASAVVSSASSIVFGVPSAVVSIVVNPVASIVAPVASGASSVVAPVVSSAASVVAPVVSSASSVVAPVISSASSVVAPVLSSASSVVAPVVSSASSVVAPVVSSAASVVAPVVSSASSVVAPVVSSASSVVAPVVSSASSVVAPVVSSASSVVAPVISAAAPVVSSASSVVAPVVSAASSVVAPVVSTVASIIAPVVPVPSVVVSVVSSASASKSAASSIIASVSAVASSASSAVVSVTSTSTTPSASATPSNAAVAGWAYNSCIQEGTNGRALTAAATAGSKMTVESCLAFCDASNFPLAGLEYSGECYCGSSLSNGASLSKTGTCAMTCSGNSLEICGGSATLSLYVSTKANAAGLSSDLTTQAVALSAGWTASSSSCIQEVSGRALVEKSTASDDMTINKCLAFCGSYKYAGLEYGRECYCGNTLQNGAAFEKTSGQCVTPCAGMSTNTCGGPNALQMYTNAGYKPASAGAWSNGGCVQEVSGRALRGASVAGSSMTIETCTSFCSSQGYTIAGLEYGQECYCDNTWQGGASANNYSGQCNMPCAGNSGQNCGGPNAINFYTIG